MKPLPALVGRAFYRPWARRERPPTQYLRVGDRHKPFEFPPPVGLLRRRVVPLLKTVLIRTLRPKRCFRAR